jgi:hypothetical protein
LVGIRNPSQNPPPSPALACLLSPGADMVQKSSPLAKPPSRTTAQRAAPFAAAASPPLNAGQGLSRRLLLPVRPPVGADDPAARAHHARPERRYRHMIAPRVRAQDRPVVAQRARHVERPHALGAHVAEGQVRCAIKAPRVADGVRRLAGGMARLSVSSRAESILARRPTSRATLYHRL